MPDKIFLTNDDLAARWGCKESTIRNARPKDLPARFVRPRSRLVRYHIDEVIAFERAHFEPRDYNAERDLGLRRGPARLPRRKRRRS